MKIVRLSKNSNLNRIDKVFKWFRFSGRGPAGPTTAQAVGDVIAAAEAKPIPADGDTLGLSDSEDNDILKNLTFANLWTWIRGLADLIYQPLSTALSKITEAGGLPLWDGGAWPGGGGSGSSRDDHGTVSSGSVALSATYSNHTYDTVGDHAWTLPDFSELLPVIHIQIDVTGGNPTVSPPASAVLASDSQQTLSSMPSGKKLVKIESFDDGVSHLVTVENAGASPTSSITEPIYTDAAIPVVFSEAQNPATVLTIGNGTGTVELFDITAGLYVAASIATSDNITWTLTPDSDLINNNDYEFHLSKEITSLVGNRKYSGDNLTFTALSLSLEDYTTYTEVDPSGFVAVTANKLAVVDLTRDISTYITFDFGAAFFSGDFVHNFEVTGGGGDNSAALYSWALANVADDLRAVEVALGSLIGVYFYNNAPGSGGENKLILRESNAGVLTTVTTSTLMLIGTKYYYQVERDETIGAFGTLYLRIYTDSGRTVLQESISIALTVKNDFRYLYALSSFNTGNANAISADIENLEIS